MNAERVGRGFNNRVSIHYIAFSSLFVFVLQSLEIAHHPLLIFQLVGHVIKGGGVAITGQEQSALINKDAIQQPFKRK